MQDKNPKSLFGIDINEYTQNVQFPIIATKIDFLYLRSSGSGSGRFRVDKKFIQFAKESRNYGIPVGAYHFGVPSYDLTDADRQCDDFINVLQEGFGEKNYGDLFPVLDVEYPIDKTISTKTLVEWIDRFRKRFEKKTRRRLMLYTGLFFIELYDNFYVEGKGYPLKNMPLWIAMYTKLPINPPYPPNIGGWTRWRVWQFSEDQKVMGVGNPVDANWGPDHIELLIQPRDVTGFKATIDKNHIYLSWDKVPDMDLLGYNIFVNNYWVATVDENATKYVIDTNKLNVPKGSPINVTIEAFDYDGETSRSRAKVKLQNNQLKS
ncbi:MULTISPECIES: glycoside hydrolase family 25 protein [Clostridium]|uniref:glycoside hydrolase family 25 protein n=1 Tax=Clostridium TaxID=1485 RepID=UPI000302BEB7|nr:MULTISPECIES: glycoside hydrolase family 25 protein [Clostridium]MBN1046496.1 muramidase [Clostridium botulinum]MBN1053200.1 muramidase [Clostridium botulinum]NFN93928.1 muramidase [Clostridium botulinum]NFR85332.1 muramidase [Clostridium botulinum]NFR89553.1 muramidase [Clostridium botulinum]